MNNRLAVHVLVSTFCLGGASSQGEVDARSTVAKGASVSFVHDSVLDAKMRAGGQEFATNEQVAWTLHLQVDDVDAEGNYSVTTRVVRVRGKIALAAGQGEAEFDSAGDADGAARTTAAAAGRLATVAAGKSFRCKVGPRGQVLELGEGKEGLLRAGERGAAMHTLDEALLRSWVEGAFGFVPPRRTAAGYRWDHTVDASFGRMPTRQQLASTLSIVDPEFFDIESTGTCDIDREAAVALDKKSGGHRIGQIESTKVTNGKVEAKQKTSRRDGFVLTASRTTTLEFEATDRDVGAVDAKLAATRTTRRATDADGLPKPAEVKGETKPPSDGKAK